MPQVGLLDHEESVKHSGLFVEEQPFGDTIAWVHRVGCLSSGRPFCCGAHARSTDRQGARTVFVFIR